MVHPDPSSPGYPAFPTRFFSRGNRPLHFAAALVACVLAIGACQRREVPPPNSATPNPTPISQVVATGDPAHPTARVRLTVDRAEMTVADRLTLVINIETQPDTRAEWASPTPMPQPPIGRLGDFTVAAHAQRTPDPTDAHAPRVTEHTFVLEPFLDGDKSIPALSFRVGPSQVETQPVTIKVSSILPAEEAEKAELAPALPPVPTKLPSKATGAALPRGVTIGLIAGATAMAGVVGWILMRRKPSGPDAAAAARGALSELRAALESAAADPFGPGSSRVATAASELASIIRTYLQRGLSIPAVGATPTELAPRLAGLPAAAREPIERTLSDLEREAFSPAQPRVAVLLDHLAVVESLILGSRPAGAARPPTEWRPA